MKTFSTALFSLALLVTGCVTSQRTARTLVRAQHGYPEEVLALRLAQDDQSGDLILTLTNLSSDSITNYFPQKVFEGSVWVIQEGTVPLKTYPSNYFNLLIRALWGNEETAIPPGGGITYRVPLESLICPFPSREPEATRPVIAYAFMDGLEAVSNAILLKNPQKIRWRTGLIQTIGNQALRAETNATSAAGSR